MFAVSLAVIACESETSSTGPTDQGAPIVASTGNSSLDVEASPDPLPPGTYSSDVFVPAVTFTIEDGWRGLGEDPGLITIQQRGEDSGAVRLMLADVTDVQGDDEDPSPASAEEAATRIEANPDLLLLGKSDSRMDGRDGFVLEVENAGQDPALALSTPHGTVTIEDGHRNWIALFDTSSGILAVIVDAPAAWWEEALLAAEPVLETVTID